MPSIFSPYQIGPVLLRNRIVMAPMTRARTLDNVPDAMTTLYYRQRASAGLIVSEGLHVSGEARGQVYTPAIYSRDQVAGWRNVTAAVHAEGGAIFAQLWHVGRNSHVSLQPRHGAPVSSSAQRCNATVWSFDEDGNAARLPASQPRALTTDEIGRVTQDFVEAACNAIEAGFDGVELHGANGYLFEQFVNGALNDRDDRYGGSVENRLRFVLETVDAVWAAVGGPRTGIRISPFGRYGDMHPFADEQETWLKLAEELSERDLAYVHVADQHTLGEQPLPLGFLDRFRRTYVGTLIVAGGLLKESGQALLDAGAADLIAIGRPFISNPDLVERLRNDWPLAEGDHATFYSRGPEGYVDYPPYNIS